MTSDPALPELELHLQSACPFDALTESQAYALARACLQHVGQAYEMDHESLELTLRFCPAEESQRLNAQYRQQDKPTNVLTFAYGIDPQTLCLRADILLCVPVLHKEAEAQQKPLHDHAAHLWVHGILHALGFDHIKEDEAREMETLEVAILKDFHIGDPYA